jgi:hypothetical protein
MCARDPSRNRQPQTRSAGVTASTRIESHPPVEHALSVLRCDARAVVVDSDQHVGTQLVG